MISAEKFDTVRGRDSVIDPRTRIICALCVSLLAIVCSDLRFLLPLFVFMLMLDIFLYADRLKVWRKRLFGVFCFFLAIAVLQSVFSKRGDPLVSVKGFSLLTKTGLEQGIMFLLRMCVIILSAVFLSAEKRRRTVQGLVQMKMPYELAFMLAVALRFIPIFSEEIRNALTAIQLRGIDLKHIAVKKRIQVYTYLFLPILGTTIVRAKEMALAMEMRAFRAYQTRTSYVELKLKAVDYVLIPAAICLTAALIVMYYLIKR